MVKVTSITFLFAILTFGLKNNWTSWSYLHAFKCFHIIGWLNICNNKVYRYYLIKCSLSVTEPWNQRKLWQCLSSTSSTPFSSLHPLFPTPTPTLPPSPRGRIGETTDSLNRLEGDLTSVQDNNYEASNELSSLEREAKELNLTSDQLNSQLDILKNSNFLGECSDLVLYCFVKLTSV